MRRAMFVAMVVGLVVAVAAPAGARDVSNSSESMVQMQGYWGSYDDSTGAWMDASIYVTEYSNETWIDYYKSSYTPITCEGDVPGTLVEYISGSGPATLEGSRTYTAGFASGTGLFGWMDSYTECWYGEEIIVPENGDPNGGHEVTLDLTVQFTSTSPLIREKGSGSFKIPGETNSHYSYSSVYRSGDVAGEVVVHMVDGPETLVEAFAGGGSFGKATWRSHSNSK